MVCYIIACTVALSKLSGVKRQLVPSLLYRESVGSMYQTLNWSVCLISQEPWMGLERHLIVHIYIYLYINMILYHIYVCAILCKEQQVTKPKGSLSIYSWNLKVCHLSIVKSLFKANPYSPSFPAFPICYVYWKKQSGSVSKTQDEPSE